MLPALSGCVELSAGGLTPAKLLARDRRAAPLQGVGGWLHVKEAAGCVFDRPLFVTEIKKQGECCA